MGPSGSDLGSSMHSSPVNSPRNSSPVHSNGNLTNNLHKMVSWSNERILLVILNVGFTKLLIVFNNLIMYWFINLVFPVPIVIYMHSLALWKVFTSSPIIAYFFKVLHFLFFIYFQILIRIRIMVWVTRDIYKTFWTSAPIAHNFFTRQDAFLSHFKNPQFIFSPATISPRP